MSLSLLLLTIYQYMPLIISVGVLIALRAEGDLLWVVLSIM